MKLLTLLITVASINLSAAGYAQKISLAVKDAPLQKVFKLIEKQTDYRFVYTKEQLQNASHVSFSLRSVTLENVLDQCLKDQALSYTIEDNLIVIRLKLEEKNKLAFHDVSGRITNVEDQPLSGVTISVKGTKTLTVTNDKGEFRLNNIDEDATLVITGAEIESQEIVLNKQSFIALQLKSKLTELDQLMVMAYGTTTKRLNTGNISKINFSEINRQPVANPLAALQGRIPGLLITQSSGVPGSAFKIQIQGQRSIATIPGSLIQVRNDPLIVIDGVPFSPGNGFLNQLPSAAGNPDITALVPGGLSPLNLINPSDIESIEVLKDADATAIFGSRGSNGVILITTKKGKAGKTRLQVSSYAGFSQVTRKADLLNTQQYIKMRREAIYNDGGIPDPVATSLNALGFAPDILKWDTTKFTDWQDYLTGGTASTTDIQTTVSGGSANTQFLISGGFHRETTVFPGDFSDKRSSLLVNLNHLSTNEKFRINFSGNYGETSNNINSKDLTEFTNVAPNFPSLLDSSGHLVWSGKGVDFRRIGFINPLSYLFQQYNSQSKNLIGNVLLSYKIQPSFIFKLNLGYNTTHVDEVSTVPKTSLNPANAPVASSSFAQMHSKTWIAEPQIEFVKKINKGKLNILMGVTWQSTENSNNSIAATGYSSDDLLRSVSAAGSITGRNNYSLYHYNAIFSRINYNWVNKYIINISGRRDGSSRFGPGRQFANFMAIGGAWVFTNENFFKNHLPALSFGKLKASYGTTGNDQIGDYKYLNIWTSSAFPYQNTPGLIPVSLFNPDFAWETNKKLQAAIELGFLKDRILLTAQYFRNRSGNQLVFYSLPTQTGFSGINAFNLPASIQNTGWELSLAVQIINAKHFTWTGSGHITIGKNKLLSFPDLDKSPYSSSYVIGESLNAIYKFQYLGVDPSSGIYQFKDVNNDSQLDARDYVVSGNLDPKFYGGFQNSFKYKRLRLDIHFEFRKQLGRNYLADQANRVPGRFNFNQPTMVLERWTKSGATADIQKFTSRAGTPAYMAAALALSNSNAIYSDASYIRLRNISISFDLPNRWMEKLRLESFSLYVRIQNLLTITDYKGADPETQSLNSLPPLRTITAGIQVTL